jgi:hypothetical protein
MKISGSILGFVGVSVASLWLLCPQAYAFGGFWSSQTEAVRQTSEQIVFVDNPDSTVTAIVQIKYAGPAQKFAWVIPLPGRPTVGVSSSTVFQRLDAATAPQYWVEVAVEGSCMQKGRPQAASGADSGAGGAPSAPDTTAAPVVIVDRGSIGPYDYVNITALRALGDPSKVATDWLKRNGYDLTGVDGKVLSPYLKDGLNLLAFKLTKGAEAGAIRPVILTYESKLPTIPIRPTSIGARDDMGIQVWVIGPSQAVPDNYRSLVINEARIDWLTGRKYAAGTLPAGGVGPFGPYVGKPSNYDAVVTAAAKEAGGQGFVTELGGPASQYRDKVWSSVEGQEFTMISGRRYADGIDAILAANHPFGGWDGWKDAIKGATTLPTGVTIDEFGRNPHQYRGVAKVDATKFFKLLYEGVVRPVADTAAMFYKAPYLTRLYGSMSPDAMTVDPAFSYNFDLAQVSNVHIAKQAIQCTPALDQDDAPWRIKLPQGGVVVGKGSRDWPVTEGSMPANLKIVSLSTTGPGTVFKDNREDIGTKLFETAGATDGGMSTPRPPLTGVMIGGTQMVTMRGQTESMHGSPQASGGGKCSVSDVGAGKASARALWLPLAGVILALRRRRRGAGRS